MSKRSPDPSSRGPASSPSERLALGGDRSAAREGLGGEDADRVGPSGARSDEGVWSESDALLNAEDPILERIGAGAGLVDVVEAVCRMIEVLCPGTTAAVVDTGGRSVGGASLGLPPLRSTEGVPGRPVLVEDVASDPRWAGSAERLLVLGLRTCWSIAIVARGEVLGTLGVFLAGVRRPSEQESRVCRRAARLAGIAAGSERADRSLRELEERHRLIAELTSDFHYAIGVLPDGSAEIESVSEGFVRLLGYTTEEVRASGWPATIHPEDLPAAHESLRRQLTGAPEGRELRMVSKGGEVRWVRYLARPLRDTSTGRVFRIVGAGQDVTEARRTEAALRESEAQFRTSFELAAVGTVQVDPATGRFLRANRTFCEITGYSVEELRRLTLRDVTHPDDREGDWAKVGRMLRGEVASVSNDKRYIRKDGREVWVSVTAALVRDGQGKPLRTIGIVQDLTERRRAEQALRASEAHYRAVYDQASVGIAEVDLSGRFLRANDRYCEIVGYSRDELLERTFQEITHPDDLPTNLGYFTQIAERRAPYTIEKRYIRKDGRVVWARAAVSLVRDVRGEPASVVAVAEDVTERARAEAALRESEGRFRQLAEVMPHIVWTAEPGGAVDYFNSRWYEYTGTTPAPSLAGDEWRGIVHPDDLVGLAGQRDRAVALGERFEGVYRLRDRTGAYRWHLVHSVAVKDEGGRVLRRFGTATDIDDRKRAEQDARFLAEAGAAMSAAVDQERTLRQVASLAVPTFADWCAVDLLGEGGTLRRVAVAHVDPDKVALAHQLHRRYAPRPDSARGVYRVIATGESEAVAEITDAMLVEGAHDEEHLRILRELQLRSYLCVPLIGRSGTLGAILFVAAETGRRFGLDDLRLAEDLARRAAVAIENARLYDALREADRRKDEFLATLAHELRNPLAPIRTALHLMAHPDADGRGFEAERAMAERQAVHLARLVDDLMDVARISRGQVELKRRVVALSPVVRLALDVVRTALAERAHVLDVALAEEPILVDADPTRLEQVLDNLLTNAIKYTEPGGRITIATARDGGEAVIRVRDTGIGIEAAMLPHVFEMFVQAERRSERAQGGLGIGLGLVKSLVEKHGGRIEARSDGPGMGSEFVVRLPALEGPSEPRSLPMADARQPGTPALSRRRVLVVDDNVDAATSLAKLLTRLYGQEVRVAHDGPSALAAAVDFAPEVALLDIGLPGMTGYEVASALRARPQSAAMFLVALTGWGQESDRQKSREAGFDRHLVKPVDPEDIRSLLTLPPPPE